MREMTQAATPVTYAIDLLHADVDRELIVEQLRDRFSLDRHDAVAAVASAGAVLRGARARPRPWNVR
jgi:hypothetical protein